MPTYDYKCGACGHQFEAFQSIKDDPLTKCPKCGNYSVKRLISPGGGLLFKGSGYYITDYRSSSYQQAAKKDTPTSTTTPKSDSTGSSKTSTD
ncbi:MAG: hypothetical protein Kow0074_08260 [Candidatus Zixiibacteriota bacterium]